MARIYADYVGKSNPRSSAASVDKTCVDKTDKQNFGFSIVQVKKL